MARPRLICGVDEAGRGPLAGPVYAAAVILDPARPVDGIADSKSLAAARREEIALAIKAGSLAWAVAQASVAEIDRLNILRAALLAMARAVTSLTLDPDEVLIDGPHCPALPHPMRAVIGGDATVPAIAAASILAKTARDAEMRRLHEIYPCYGFDRHKGYPTAAHLEALRRHGACEAHRRSFAPVGQALGMR
ncbi:MAG: ribonuclease HII [Betaproteobacteria bacterium]|nr:ribonuclease HII [Betaproteobacteria bacterium]MBI2958895.1 ribonuclease HII [Betaproteobacteria bacterium]